MYTHRMSVEIPETGLTLPDVNQLDVVQDMFSPGQPFTFTISKTIEHEPRWDTFRAAIKAEALIVVRVDDAAVMVGRIGEITSFRKGAGRGITISGHDLVTGAQRWDADPRTSLRGLALADAVEVLLRPLGLQVLFMDTAEARAVQMGTSRSSRRLPGVRRRGRIDRARPQPGEKIMSVVEALVRRSGYMIFTAYDTQGAIGLCVDTPAYSSAPVFSFRYALADGRVTVDSNVLEMEHKLTTANTPTEVTVYGSNSHGDALSSRHMVELSNLAAFNPDVLGGFRASEHAHPMHVRAHRARTPAAALREAQRIIADANAHLRTYTCTVQGFGQDGPDGVRRIYATNTMARVDDGEEGVNELMLIDRVHMRAAADGATVTQLRLSPRGMIALSPEDG